MNVTSMGNTTNTAYGIQTFQPSSNRFNLMSYRQFEHMWSYLGKFVQLSRQLLNAAAKNCSILSLTGRCFPHRIKRIVTYMKLLAIVGVPSSLISVSSIGKRISKSVLNHDTEAIALGALSLSITTADTIDSLATFVNSALALASIDPIEALAALGLPLAGAMAGLGTVSRTIHIAKTYHLYQHLNPDLLVGSRYQSTLKRFLKDKLDLSDEEMKLIETKDIAKLKERKKAAILRAAPEEAVEELEELFTKLNEGTDKPLTDRWLKEIFATLDKVQRLLQKKMTIDGLGILANLIMISALALFSVGTASSLPYLLLAYGFTVRIASIFYQDYTAIGLNRCIDKQFRCQ